MRWISIDNQCQRRRKPLLAIASFAVATLCAVIISLAGTYLYLDPQTPAAESYRNVKLQQPLRIFAADGALIAEFGERRLIPITLAEVPQQFVNALLDTEDKRFYEHQGIDFIRSVMTLCGCWEPNGQDNW